MANPDRTRKLLIRTAIVTTSTAATLFGAQNLAMLDSKDLQLTPTPSASTTMAVVESPTVAPQISQGLANITIQQSAPSVTILRHSPQPNTTTASISNTTTSVNRSSGVIQPPAPSQVSAPQPVIIQQPMQQVTQSSQ